MLVISKTPLFPFFSNYCGGSVGKKQLTWYYEKRRDKTKSTMLNLLSPSSLTLPLTHQLQRHKSFYLRSFNILETSPSSVQIYDIRKQERIIFCKLRVKLPFYAATTWEENCFSTFTLFLSTKNSILFYVMFKYYDKMKFYIYLNERSLNYLIHPI